MARAGQSKNKVGRIARHAQTLRQARLIKVPSGIHGFDDITGGGLPQGRPTLVCGGAGCGKTLFAMEFIVRGARHYGEPGVFIAFEEPPADLAANVASLGFNLQDLIARKKLFIDYVRIERSEIEETGEYDLEGLFIRIQSAIEAIGAKRIVLDTVEALFAGFTNQAILRAELRRLFRWLKERGMTTVITGEKGTGQLTREGLEEYVSDCVIFLDHRVHEQHSTRRLRVVKYRGSSHGTDEYPFFIDDQGISILPVTSIGLTHRAFSEHVSSGIPRLDEMLGGDGYYKGSTVLVSGSAGTGKTSIAAHLARATCQSKRKCLFFTFEESRDQLVRNMRSIGIQLEKLIKSSLLNIAPARPSAHGLEVHLGKMHKLIDSFHPDVVLVDPITSMTTLGTTRETQSMLIRLIDFLKIRAITTLLTSLTSVDDDLEQSGVGISSLIDTWLMLDVVKNGGERNRALTIVKSRGMAHSNQASEYLFTNNGIVLADTYLGSGSVLTGSARVAKEAEDEATHALQSAEVDRLQKRRERRRALFETQISSLREQFATDDEELDRTIQGLMTEQERSLSDRRSMSKSRKAFALTSKPPPRNRT